MRWTKSSLAVLLGLSAARAHAAPPHHRSLNRLTGTGQDLLAAGSSSHSGPGAGSASSSDSTTGSDASSSGSRSDDDDDLPYLASQMWDASIYARDRYSERDPIPGARKQDSWNQTAILAVDGSDDISQNPHCDTVFIGTAAASGFFLDGWEGLPSVLGFDLMRDLWVNNPDHDGASVSFTLADSGSGSSSNAGSGSSSNSGSAGSGKHAQAGAVFPYYIEHGKNASLIKRAVIAIPGVPRDTWKVINEVRNSLICTAYANDDLDLSEILIVGPVWMTQTDRKAGTGEKDDLYWPAGNSWGSGVPSEGPHGVRISAFSALDALVSILFDDSVYPNLNNVVVAGHSVGGALTQRYASIRRNTAADSDLIYWAGNPSVYTWPSAERPVRSPADRSCNATRNQWPYGMDLTNVSSTHNLAYAPAPPVSKHERAATAHSLAQQYFARHVHIGCGLADDEAGAPQCQAAYQGSTHLTRCQNLQKQVESTAQDHNQTWDYIPGVGHQEYLMFSARETQERLFLNSLNTRFTSLRSTDPSTPSRTAGPGLTGHLSPAESQNASTATPTASAEQSGSAARPMPAPLLLLLAGAWPIALAGWTWAW